MPGACPFTGPIRRTTRSASSANSSSSSNSDIRTATIFARNTAKTPPSISLITLANSPRRDISASPATKSSSAARASSKSTGSSTGSSFRSIAMHATPEPAEAADALSEALGWLMPFHFFYEKDGLPLPDFRFLRGDEVPYPYRSLLVHTNDMTPTLAAFHHSRLYLEVHEHESSEAFVMRLVTLHAAASDAPVEYGAIAIQLGGLPPELSAEVAAGRKPLGALLGEFGIEHRGEP